MHHPKCFLEECVDIVGDLEVSVSVAIGKGIVVTDCGDDVAAAEVSVAADHHLGEQRLWRQEDGSVGRAACSQHQVVV